jgi:hypothetical protein
MAKVMASIEHSGFSLSGVIASCAAAHDMGPASGFLQREAATCPAGAPEDAPAAGSPAAERAAYEQRVRPLLAVAVGSGAPEWAASNIAQGLAGSAGDAAIGSLFRALSYNAYAWTPIAGAAVFVCALATRGLACVTPLGRRLSALGLEQRLVSYQHLLFAAVFALQLVPYTVLFCRFFFMRWSPEYFVGTDAHICEVRRRPPWHPPAWHLLLPWRPIGVAGLPTKEYLGRAARHTRRPLRPSPCKRRPQQKCAPPHPAPRLPVDPPTPPSAPPSSARRRRGLHRHVPRLPLLHGGRPARGH